MRPHPPPHPHPRAIEKCELSSFGLQCPLASAAVRGKMEGTMKSRGGPTENLVDTLSSFLQIHTINTDGLRMTQRSAGVIFQPSSQVKISLTDCFYTYLRRNDGYLEPCVHQVGVSTPNMEAGTKPLCPWINGSQARADLCFTAQNKQGLRSIEKKVIPTQRSGADR